MKEKMDKMQTKIKWLGVFVGTGVWTFLVAGWQQRCINQWVVQTSKNKGMFLLMDQWVNIRQEGKSLETYFKKNNYKKIAIYGMGTIGKRLAKELKNSEIEIVYGIDRNRDNIYSDIEIVTVSDKLPRVDAVVITILNEFYEICDTVTEKIGCPVVAIEDILNEI